MFYIQFRPAVLHSWLEDARNVIYRSLILFADLVSRYTAQRTQIFAASIFKAALKYLEILASALPKQT